MLFRLFFCVFCNFLNNTEIHKWFTAEVVDFYIFSVTAVIDNKINSFLTYFRTHKTSATVKFTCIGKTILTSQITVMCNVNTKSLYNRLLIPILRDFVVAIICKQLTCIYKCTYFSIAFFQFFFTILIFQTFFNIIGTFCLCHKRLKSIIKHIVHYIINNVYRT